MIQRAIRTGDRRKHMRELEGQKKILTEKGLNI